MQDSTAQKCLSNTPTIFPKRQLSFYAALLCIVGPVWIVSPLSIFLVGWLAVTRPLYSLTRWELALFIYCIIEVSVFFIRRVNIGSPCQTIFFVYHTAVARKLRNKPAVLPQYDLYHLRSLFTRILQTGLAPVYPDNDDDVEDEAAGSRPGSPAESIERLEWDDPRAVDFRHRMRTWYVSADT